MMKLFLIALSVYLVFYLLTGGVFVRYDLSDIGFHLERSLSPLDFSDGYYAPLLHLVLFVPSIIFFPELVFSLLIPVFLFVLLPLSFILLCWSVHGDGNYGRLYLFGSFATYFFVFTGTYAQALNLFFINIVLSMLFIYDRLVWELDKYKSVLPDINPWTIRFTNGFYLFTLIIIALGFFSHSIGGIYLLVLFFTWLCLTERYVQAGILISLILMVLHNNQFLIDRIIYYISMIPSTIKSLSNIWEVLRVIGIWLNPLVFYFAVRHYIGGGVYSSIQKTLISAILLALVFSILDPQLRPIIYANVFALVLIVDDWNSKKWLRETLTVWNLSWAVFYFILFGIVTVFKL